MSVRVRVIEPQRHYCTHSQSTDQTYHLTRTGHGWRCDCPGFQFTGMCKHLGALTRRAERENWSIDRIAPPIDCTGDPMEIDGVAEIMAGLQKRRPRTEVR